MLFQQHLTIPPEEMTMSNILLKTAMVLALGIAPGAACAQTELPQQQPSQGGGQMPADGGTDSQGTASPDSQKSPTGAGQLKQNEQQSGQQTQDPAGQDSAQPKMKSDQQTGESMKKDGQTGTEAQAPQDKPAGQQSETTTKSGQKTQGESDTSTESSTTNEQTGQDGSTADSAGQSNETTGSINVTTEQKTEIKQIITETKAEPVRDVDFEVNVGVSVPRTLELQPLPPRIVQIVPRYEGYRYFVLADGRIIIVDPDSYEIVYVIV